MKAYNMHRNVLEVQELKERVLTVQFLHTFYKQSIRFYKEKSLQRNEEISKVKDLIEVTKREERQETPKLSGKTDYVQSLTRKNQRLEELLFHVKAQIAQSKSETESVKDMVNTVKKSILIKEQQMKQLVKYNISEITQRSRNLDNH